MSSLDKEKADLEVRRVFNKSFVLVESQILHDNQVLDKSLINKDLGEEILTEQNISVLSRDSRYRKLNHLITNDLAFTKKHERNE